MPDKLNKNWVVESTKTKNDYVILKISKENIRALAKSHFNYKNIQIFDYKTN